MLVNSFNGIWNVNIWCKKYKKGQKNERKSRIFRIGRKS